MDASLLSRSRSRISASLGTAQPLAKSRRSRPSVGRSSRARNDRVEVAEAVVRLGEAEVVGKLLPRRLRDDARAGERHQRARLREHDVAEAREAREHAARRRMREHREQRAARLVQLLDRARPSSAAA